MCDGEELLRKLEKARAGVLDDEVLAYARKVAKDKKLSKDFLIRAGIHDKDGHVIGLSE